MSNDFCKIEKNQSEGFVGLKFTKDGPAVCFPMGFEPSEDENQRRKDIIRLFAVIKRFGKEQNGSAFDSTEDEALLSFPFLSYQHIILDFLENGYYKEREHEYKTGTNGRINWQRTIKKKTPYYSNGSFVYLDFIVKKNKINADNMLTKIHMHCVRESFEKLGWLYLASDILPPKPDIRFNKEMFVDVLRKAISNTFNTQKKHLFTSMLDIIEQKEDCLRRTNEKAYGINQFAPVWENLIDHVFGTESNKNEYFPNTQWHIINSGDISHGHSLRPDTIMKLEDVLYILDAKYYRYGISYKPEHLPPSSSIEKQIVYGEYAEMQKKIPGENIYNAFIMPYKSDSSSEHYKFVSIGTSNWKDYKASPPNYYFVLGVLLDTRFLIEEYSRRNISEIEKLSELITESLKNYKKEYSI